MSSICALAALRIVLAKAAIAATVASGIRSIYGYCFTGRVASWSPFSFAPNPLEPWVLETLKELSQSAPFGDGRVILGLAFDLWFLPKEILVPLFEQIRSFGVDRITTHQTPPPPGKLTTFPLGVNLTMVHRPTFFYRAFGVLWITFVFCSPLACKSPIAHGYCINQETKCTYLVNTVT